MLAFALVAVPGVFAVFPELSEWDPILKWIVLGVWLGIVWVSARGALAQEARLDELVGPAFERRYKQKALATPRLLGLLLAENHGMADHKFHLYTYDKIRNELVASYTTGRRPQNWRVGHGVTGEAWRRAAHVLARGEETHDGTYGLSDAEQRRYADVAIVAALPVLDDRNRPLAILTASCETDDGFLASPDGYDRHQELAQITGRILMDITDYRPDM